MLKAGIYLPPSQFEACFVYTEHGQKDFDTTRQLPLSASWRSDTFNSVRYNYDTFAFDVVAFLFGFLFMVLSDSGRL